MPVSSHTQGQADGAANLAAALHYLAMGWPVLAECPPDHAGMSERHLAICKSQGKCPWHRWKEFQPDDKGRLPTPPEVTEWWRQHPTSNVGLALGAIARIDIEGAQARQRLGEMSGGDLPDTLEFTSGRGDGTGEGVLYALPPDARLRTRREGLALGGELRLQALGAQTVLPPSRHHSGRLYAWKPGRSPRDIAIACAPSWLLAALRAPSRRLAEKPSAANGADTAPETDAIKEGERNTALFKIACKLARSGLTPASVDAALQAENQARCHPPLESAEVAAIARSACEQGKKKETNAEILLEIALTDSELWHTPDAAYATIRREGHREHWPVRSKGYQQWLAKRFFDAEGKAIGSQAKQDVLGTIESRATFDGPTYARCLRVAEHEGRIYVDLADDAWRAVQVDESGWCVVADPPVRFVRPARMSPLPGPEQGGSLDLLRRFVNVEDEHWPLVLGWLVAALRPTGPYAVLRTRGEQGSAKTTMARVLRSLVDPNECPTRGTPRCERDLMIAAENGWVCAFDNLSFIPPELSDSLCRLSSGGGFGVRTHYENAEETVFHSSRPLLLNGIEDVGTRSDLMDRSLIVELPRLNDEDRMPEKVFNREFEKVRPLVVGALLTAVSTALKNLPDIERAGTVWPRMADFAQWVVAAEPALGLEPGAFMKAYLSNRESANQIALESSPVPDALLKLLVQKGGTFQGTATELLDELSNGQKPEVTRGKSWPKNARALAGVLERLAPNLRQSGLNVEHWTEKNKKLWRFEVTPASPEYASAQNTQESQERFMAGYREELRKRGLGPPGEPGPDGTP